MKPLWWLDDTLVLPSCGRGPVSLIVSVTSSSSAHPVCSQTNWNERRPRDKSKHVMSLWSVNFSDRNSTSLLWHFQRSTEYYKLCINWILFITTHTANKTRVDTGELRGCIHTIYSLLLDGNSLLVTETSPHSKRLHMLNILDIFSPYSSGVKRGWHVRKYSDNKMANISGTLLISNLLCKIWKQTPKEKLSREARWGVQVLTAFCRFCLEPEKQTLRISM